MAKSNIASQVFSTIRPTVESCGVTLWDVQYVKEGADRYLRITIDKENGVSIDDCERVHRAVDPVIDALDPIAESYYMEVASPGLGRRLTRPEHFAAKTGQTVAVRLIRPDETGTRDWRGSLLPCEGDSLRVLTETGERAAALSAVSYVRLCDDEDLF